MGCSVPSSHPIGAVKLCIFFVEKKKEEREKIYIKKKASYAERDRWALKFDWIRKTSDKRKL